VTAPGSAVEREITRRIRERGRIPFAEVMEAALYLPGKGYYTSGVERVGARGDFYTSPHLHPVYGAIIALALQRMWRLMGRPPRFWAIELGAGKGLMACDVIRYSRRLASGFRRALRYVALERGAAARLPGVERVVASGIPVRGVSGCILSNEFFDALPVHRLVRRDGELREAYVGVEAEKLVESEGDLSTRGLAEHLRWLGSELPEDARFDVALDAPAHMRELGRTLDHGFVLTVDYGARTEELLARPQGSLVCYYRHRAVDDPLARPGDQDVTAHVDFSALVKAGREVGLEPVAYLSQREFLAEMGLNLYLRRLTELRLPQGGIEANGLAVRTLAEDGGLGDFRVLVQVKGVVPPPSSRDLLNGEEASRLAASRDGLPVPVLDRQRLDLLSARYPLEAI